MIAVDLMIGNYVYDNLGGILRLKGIKEDSDCSHLRGIPLSEEWIVGRFGFKRDGRLHPTYRLGMIIVEKAILEVGVYFVRKAISSTDSALLRRIRFVHELQNVYYHNNDNNKSLTVIR